MLICPNNKKINTTSRQNTNFDGKFYAMTDGHSRTLKMAGVITEIEKRCSDKTPATFLDCGDFTAGSYSNEATVGVYAKFAQRNPHIQAICNLGNCEIFDFKNPEKIEKFQKYVSTLTDSGVRVVCGAIDFLSKKFGAEAPKVKPYTIIEDVVDGQKKKVLVTGITTANDEKIIDLNNQKQILKELLPKAISEHSPDKIVLLSHNFMADTKELTRYLKEDLKINNLELVIGGHPHSVEDETQSATRILYPPAQGQGAYEIELTSRGFEIPKINRFPEDGHDYDSLNQNKQEVIKNNNVAFPIAVEPSYRTIIDEKEPTNMDEKIVTAFHSLQYRKPGKQVSETCELGTFISNAMRDQTHSDFAVFLTMDLRERLPQKGENIRLYNIKDTLNVNKPVCILKVNTQQLVDIFELSLKEQHKKNANSTFFEFSDNIKIERFVKRDEKEPKLKQIYIKSKKNKWIPLLDSQGKVRQKMAGKTFTVATCDFVAKAKRESLEMFKTVPYTLFKDGGLTTEQVFIKALKDNEHNPNFAIKRSEIADILP